MPASDLFWMARAHKGWTQRQLAERLGVSQPSIAAVESGAKDATLGRVEAVLREAQLRLVPVPSWAMTAADASHLVRETSAEPKGPFWESNRLRPVIQLSDDLARVDDVVATCLIAQPPAPTGEAWLDVLIAGTCEIRMRGRRIPRPVWLDDPRLILAEPYDVEPLEALRELGRQNTPEPLRRRNLFLDASFFASV